MTYECNQCGNTLPAGAVACAKCGNAFSEPVPADAVLPESGFRAATVSPSDISGSPGQLCADLRVLKSQIIQLTNRTTVMEMAAREDKRRFTEYVQDVLCGLQRLDRQAS